MDEFDSGTLSDIIGIWVCKNFGETIRNILKNRYLLPIPNSLKAINGVYYDLTIYDAAASD